MANKKVTQVKLRPVLEVAPWDIADVVAMKAVANGIADEHQQRRAINWILYQACDFHGISFRDSDRETALAEGKRFVAQQINALLTLDISTRNRITND